jgi:phenylalanyl-tRNA synthetase beta chain
MQFPESWLREFCNPPLSSEELAHTLTMAGLEVEAHRPAAPPFHHVVVAEVLSVLKHPEADRLKVCQVKVAPDTTLQIVCGAPNVRAGIKVACALVGALLPPAEGDGSGLEIKLGKLRGVESQGMLCSAVELQLQTTAASAGLLELSEDAVVGASIRTHLQLDDTIFTLKLTPNLAHALSVYGVARELSALTGAPLQTPVIRAPATAHHERLAVTISAPDLCGRYAGRSIRGINPRAPTPAWMVQRLERCGQRPVSPLVDISNYVMFELGQPSHIFDLDKIEGDLCVRWAQPGEKLALLNGQTITLDAQVGVIADAKGAACLAGIMGGLATAVSDTTQNVYVESAFWWPEAIAGRARKYQFSTDASHRFERGVDPQGCRRYLERVTQLILDICGGQAGEVDEQTTAIPERQAVRLRIARAEKIIGMPLSMSSCAELLGRLGLQVRTPEEGVLSVTPPSWRFDLQIEEDLVEEVLRVMGFDQLPDTPPLAHITPRVRPETQPSLNSLRRAVAALDYQETINFSFVPERWEHELAGNRDPIRLLNPIAAPLSVMRSSLCGSLLDILCFNIARKAARVRIFEVGRVFEKNPQIPDSEHSVAGVAQPLRIGGLAYGDVQPVHWENTPSKVDFFDVKGDVEALFAPQAVVFSACTHPALHPGRAAQISLDGAVVGWVGELHPRWCQGYGLPLPPIVFELDAAALAQTRLSRYAPVQRQQSVWRDISVVLGPQVGHDALIQVITSVDPETVRSACLFDIYQSNSSQDMAPDERSLSVRLELLDDTHPLTDERAEAIKARVLAALQNQLQARIR